MRPHLLSRSRRALFLAGVSMVAMAASSGASARPFGLTGGGAPPAPTVASGAAQDAAQQALLAARNSQQSLERATKAIQALQAAQSAARALAMNAPSNIPNGLVTGGLVPDTSGLKSPGVANPVVNWSGANTPTQTTNGGKTTVNIEQTQPTALLNWQTFNVGRDTTVNFDQKGNTTWSALNKITSNTAPSQIQGAIKADGAVYLINPNGIIFGGSSQINVNTLVASTLNFSGSFTPAAIPNGFTGSRAGVFEAGPQNGTVTVQPGAIIDTTGKLNANGDGGFVALLGSGVTNAGSITTRNGQIIMAADQQKIILIAPPQGYVGTGTAMQVVLTGGGVVTNEAGGLLVSNSGAVTLSGNTINQLGGILATTATTRTGSIMLSTVCAGVCAGGGNGDIVLGASSLTSILPDETSGTLPTATANSTGKFNGSTTDSSYFQAVLQPKIDILAAGSVDVQGSGEGADGAFIKAPGAALTIRAGANLANGTAGLVLLEKGSSIDLSGLAGVTLPMSVNQLSITVTSAEVADHPLAKSLIGKTVLIDARVGSPILDVDGYIGLIPQSIQQILTAGGSFTTSGRNVVQQPGAVVNVSAGYVQYTGGVIRTTRLLGADGRVYDIGSADANIRYLGIANGFTVFHNINGQRDDRLTEVYLSPLGRGGSNVHNEASYITGADAGSASVAAVNPILNAIIGNVVAGDRQRAGLDKMPSGASLSLTFAKPSTDAASANPNTVVLQSQADAGGDPYGLGGLTFANASTWSPTLANGVFSIFTDVLSNASLGSVTIKGARQLDMATNAVLSVRPGGSITLDGVGTIDGTLSAPAGHITLTGFTYPVSSVPQSPPTSAVVIGSHAVLDVAGRWVNDTGLLPDQLEGDAFIDGGTVSIATISASAGPSNGDGAFTDVTQSIVLAPGSIIDVSGGGYVATSGKLKTGSKSGQGGDVKLTTYVGGWVAAAQGEFANAFNVLPHGTNPDGTVNRPNQANVLMGGTIYAGGFGGGGTLELQVPTVVIDGETAQVTSYVSSATAARIGASAEGFAVSDANSGKLVLPPSFFTSGGFSQYTLHDVYGGTTVTAGTQLVLQQPTVVPPAGGVVQIPTGVPVREFASAALLPEGLRQPVSLTLNGTSVLLDSGAAIVTDPRATVTLVGGHATDSSGTQSVLGSVTVLGSIVAPGGAINVFGNVSIGAGALLDVGGVFVPDPRVVAYATGTVYDGGTITLGGNTVVVRPGAQFNLQGAAVTAESNLIQQPQGGLAPSLIGQAAWSNGGNLQLMGSNIYFAGSVNAAGGAPLATGGTLTIGDIAIPSAVASVLSVPIINLPDAIVIEPAGRVAANLPAAGASPPSGAFIGADTLSDSGFDSVTLNAARSIAFAGAVDVKIPGALTLRADNGQFVLLPASTGLLPPGITDPTTFAPGSCGTTNCIPGIGGTTVNLNAGYVRIVGFTPNRTGSFSTPTLADGTLNVSAQWIDLQGAIALDNIAAAGFTSTSAIRLLPDNYGFVTDSNGSGRPTAGGALVAPGNLTLKAAEIYPVSNTDFALMSTGKLDSASTIRIEQNGTPTAPLSAGGGILLSARVIEQGGTLWAPLGSIILGVRTGSDVPTQFASALSVVAGDLFAPGAFTATTSVTLAAGSRTSVSAAGLVIPDGYTVDGTTWYQGSPTDGRPANTAPPVLTAPPSKSISLFGDRVTTSEGAVLDLNGGGDIYATEFVGGTGGTRNVLATYQQNLATGAVTPQYADDGRQVYALVPSYQAAVAAYDPNFASRPYYSGASAASGGAFRNAITPGQSVTIGPGSSIPAGTYTLLPGMYATLPGAYRVVQTAGNVNPNTPVSFTSPDGSQYVTGKLGNALSGTQSSQTAMFQLQSQAVWSQYSRIDITSGTTFFRNQALAAGNAPPPLPIDGGVLRLGASVGLDLQGSNLFAPGTSALAPGLVGGGGQVQIGGGNIVVLGSDKSVPPGVCVGGSAAGCTDPTNYLALDADQISRLGASSVLIGGTASVVNGVQNITATALNLEIASGAVLTGPELLLVSKAGGRGVVVDAGSVIQAVGVVPAGTSRDISFGADPVAQFNSSGTLTGYTMGISGDGSLLRVSNGSVVNVTRFFVPGQYTGPGTPPASSVPQGAFSVGAGAVIDGGNALTLDSSGSGSLTSSAILRARNYDIAGSVINIGDGASGIVLNDAVIANFNDAVSVRLRSATVINLYDVGGLQIGDPSHPIGTLIFDSAGLYSKGGSTTVSATNITLANSRGATGTGIVGTGGTLTLDATGIITEDLGAKSLGGFGQINLNAGQAIAFSGNGSLDTGPVATAALSFKVSGAVVANGGSGYTSVPSVTVSGSGGAGATATASLGVTKIAIAAGGTGYSNGDLVTVTGPHGGGFTGKAIVDGTGAIIGVTITAGGTGYTGPITAVSVSSAAGSGASLSASLGVVGVTVVTAGDGYTGIPTFSFSGGGGTGAVVTALADVTDIHIVGGGDGYVTAPTVTVSGGGGSQTTVTASVSGLVVSDLHVTGGTGYSSLPTISFSGGGARSANMLLSAPVIVVNGGATQSVLTSGKVTLATGAGTAPASVATNIGGALAITGGSITDNATIRALSGNVTLAAAAGNVELGAGALIDASGSRIRVLDLAQDAPGGNVRLVSTTGNVTINPGATVSVAAAGNGFAGSLSILAANTATLDGTLDGHAAFKDLGGDFTLQAGSLGGSRMLPLAGGFSSSFTVRLGSGDIAIAAGQTLSSGKVLLVADTGRVVVDGTIDASGPRSGSIALYGAGVPVVVTDSDGHTYNDIDGGVTIHAGARLLANYRAADANDPASPSGTSSLVQKGGTITLGTTGTPDKDGAGAVILNDTYGYQTISGKIITLPDGTTRTVSKAGKITVDAGAVFDVSGGPGGTDIDNTGGSVVIRAPILSVTDTATGSTTRNVNVSFNGTIITNADRNGAPTGSGVVLNAYAVWSTTDGCASSCATTVAAYNALTPEQQTQLERHFDGIIDPAGFFDASLTNGKPTQIIFASNGLYPISTIDLPADGAYMPHVKFYQDTLVKFVNDPFDAAAVAANFAGARLQIAGSSAPAVALSSTSMLHLRPEIDLVNPSKDINNGNITVASNWNFGAGAPTGSNTTLYYRTSSGEPGTLALRALNNVQINATISDGFYQPNAGQSATAADAYAQEITSAAYAAYEALFQGGVLTYSGTIADVNLGSGLFNTSPQVDAGFFTIPGVYNADFLFDTPQPLQNFHLARPALISENPDLPGDPTLRAQVIDQYNQFYIQYVEMYHAYQVEIVQGNTNAGIGVGQPSGLGGYFSYADVPNVLATFGGGPAVIPATSIPVGPTKANPYLYYNISSKAQPGTGTDYVSLWQNYFFGVVDANLQSNAFISPGSLDAALNGAPRTLANVTGLDTLYCAACFAVTPPTPPPVYVALFADTYQPTPPPPTPPPSALPPANQIANNPAVFNGAAVYNTTAATALMSSAVSGKGSFSYEFVAGAAFRPDNTLSVDPGAVTPVSSLPPTVTGNVTIDGHTSYTDTLSTDSSGVPRPLTIHIPTLVRTGTGSITIAAAGNVELLDQVAPGAVYTAGAATTTPTDFKAPTLPGVYTDTPNGLVSTPAWANGGGAVTVAAGGSIIGIEMPTDVDGSQTGIVGAATGQMWSDWYIHYGKSNGTDTPFAGAGNAQTAAWINYATFFQGFGALGGGDITLSAGADIVDVGASLPETLVVGGGIATAAKATYYGGGNLSVVAGGDLLSSNFLVGRGTGLIRVGGEVQATTSNPLNQGKPTKGITTDGSSRVTGSYALPLLLAVQDGFITLAARGAVTLGNVYDPASLPLNAAVRTPYRYLPGAAGRSNITWSNLFTSYGPGSGIALTSITGDVTALTVAPAASAGLFAGQAPSESVSTTTIGLLLPATLDLAALSGSIVFNSGTATGGGDVGHANLLPYPTSSGDSTGTISLVAAGSIDLGAGLTMPDILNGTTQYIGSNAAFDFGNYISPLGAPLPILTQALHANDPDPVIIAAGQDIYAVDAGRNRTARLALIKPARIEAGNNIYAGIANGRLATTSNGTSDTNFSFIGQNNNASDITSIVAGNDLVGGSYVLYGPGTFVLQAGHDLGPFAPSTIKPATDTTAAITSTSGIATLGNGSAVGTTFGSTFGGADTVKPYLPAQGAEINVLFGVRPGIDYAAAISQYIDPTRAGAGGIDFLATIASVLGQPRDQAWTTFQGLSPERQRLLVNRAFLDFVIQVGKDYKDTSSPYFGQYARAYTAISTLFPAGLGYTDNSLSVAGNAAPKIATGKLNIAASVLETQMGGDINIVGPGGGITVGHTSLDILQPNQEGILTLAGGAIRAFADDSILVNQSRIMTQQGGDIGLFVANGDINAGSGPKTYVSSPAVSVICTDAGYCYTNPQGLVTGAGVAALVTLPGQDPTRSNVTLVAPRGTIDLGAAGIRGNDITLVAQIVLNAFNIQATGAVTGLAFTPPPNVALATTTNVTAATQQSGQPAQARPNEQPSVIIVEVVGYGGSGGGIDSDEDERRKRGQGQ